MILISLSIEKCVFSLRFGATALPSDLHSGPIHKVSLKRFHIVEVEINLRPTVSRPVCLGVSHPSETRDKFSFSLEYPLVSCGLVTL
jgi:hypothetical protein